MSEYNTRTKRLDESCSQRCRYYLTAKVCNLLPEAYKTYLKITNA